MRFTLIVMSFVALATTPTFAFASWPSAADNQNGFVDREGAVRRFFRWLGFARPPIFGFSHYNHLDLGEPGELRNDVELRLGPKANTFFENGFEQQYVNQPLRPPVWAGPNFYPNNNLEVGPLPPRQRRSTRQQQKRN